MNSDYNNNNNKSMVEVHVFTCTVEPPSKGHFGTSHFVPCREVVLFSEVEMYCIYTLGDI